MIDLHCHSHFSDGHCSPAELVQKAIAQGLECLSLTDHDTVAGYQELWEEAKTTSLRIINGIEISTRWKKYDVHILGYGIQHSDILFNLIEQQNRNRIQRAKEMGEALRAADLINGYEKACEVAGHGRVGRPHFARVLVNEGKAKDMQAAFKRYLVRGRIGYVPTEWVSIPDAVEVITQSGGQAVIAHPLKYGLTRTKLHELINTFVEAGGVGIEVVSGEMSKHQIGEAAGLSHRFKLLASTGSDYHGDTVSRIGLGRQQPLPEQCTPIWQGWTI